MLLLDILAYKWCCPKLPQMGVIWDSYGFHLQMMYNHTQRQIWIILYLPKFTQISSKMASVINSQWSSHNQINASKYKKVLNIYVNGNILLKRINDCNKWYNYAILSNAPNFPCPKLPQFTLLFFIC